VKALVIGCGRVGAAVANALHAQGWDIVAVDESEGALTRLGEHWPGGFVLGHALDAALLESAGIAEADAVVVATDGDNTNLVVAQVAKLRYRVPSVSVRVLDPARAYFYADRGLRIVCPTTDAIEALVHAALATETKAG
jgi:trk system potassium uptake protein TrkA